jgi:hypothetical protein
MSAGEPKARLKLRFEHREAIAHLDDPVQQDLSAAARYRQSLFLSCDEGAGVDRLTESEEGGWGNHRHFTLGELVKLPGGKEGEMDIEGLDCDGDWLWVVGSHSLKRDKPDGKDPVEGLGAMADIDRDRNRYFLGRFPLAEDGDGAVPKAEHEGRRAAHVKFTKKRGKLMKWLDGDEHLAPFLELPSKENGLDIEGIAARGDRLWLGLRGPVLRGRGVILELDVKLTGSGHLKARRIDGKRRYRKHLLPTRGLGVRDLAWDGDDMLVLVGPTMTGDGPAHVLRWKHAARRHTAKAHADEAVEHVLELPYRGPVDHPEGLVPWGDDWLVVYDSPAEDRVEDEGSVVSADIWRVP